PDPVTIQRADVMFGTSRLPANRIRKSRTRLELLALEDRTVPATLVWTGDQDANWGTNNAGNTNWSTNALPADGDSLVFPFSALNFTNTNNMGGLDLVAITFGGINYAVGGNSITLTSLSDGGTGSANARNLPLSLPTDLPVTVRVASTTLTAGVSSAGVGSVS